MARRAGREEQTVLPTVAETIEDPRLLMAVEYAQRVKDHVVAIQALWPQLPVQLRTEVLDVLVAARQQMGTLEVVELVEAEGEAVIFCPECAATGKGGFSDRAAHDRAAGGPWNGHKTEEWDLARLAKARWMLHCPVCMDAAANGTPEAGYTTKHPTVTTAPNGDGIIQCTNCHARYTFNEAWSFAKKETPPAPPKQLSLIASRVYLVRPYGDENPEVEGYSSLDSAQSRITERENETLESAGYLEEDGVWKTPFGEELDRDDAVEELKREDEYAGPETIQRRSWSLTNVDRCWRCGREIHERRPFTRAWFRLPESVRHRRGPRVERARDRALVAGGYERAVRPARRGDRPGDPVVADAAHADRARGGGVVRRRAGRRGWAGTNFAGSRNPRHGVLVEVVAQIRFTLEPTLKTLQDAGIVEHAWVEGVPELRRTLPNVESILCGLGAREDAVEFAAVRARDRATLMSNASVQPAEGLE